MELIHFTYKPWSRTLISILNTGVIMKKFEGLWVNALVSAAAPLAEDSAFRQSQNHSAEKSTEQAESLNLSDTVEMASA